MLEIIGWLILIALGLGLAALAVYCAGAVGGVALGLASYYLDQLQWQLPRGARRLGRSVGRLIHRRAPARR